MGTQIKQENMPDRVSFQVNLTQIKEQLTLQMSTMQTILDVKARIQRMGSIPMEKIDLVYLGDQLDNAATLSSYNIVCDGATLYAIFPVEDARRLEVFIEEDQRTIKLKVKDWCTVVNVKSMIESTVGVPVEKQIVCQNNSRLKDDQDLYYSPTHMIHGMEIYVTDEFHGRKMKLLVGRNDYVKDLRKEAGLNEEGLFFFKGEVLYDHHSLGTCGIKDNDIIYHKRRIYYV